MKKTLLFCIALVSCLSLTAQVNLDSGLVGCYPFSGNANDFSGNGNNGVVHGATLTTDRFGNPNSAYSFVRTSQQYIDVPNFISMVPTNDLSISIWTQESTAPAACPIMLIADSEQSRICGCVQYEGSYDIWDYGDILGGGRMIYSISSTSTTWQHYVFIISQSKNVKKMYLNGALLDSTAYTGINLHETGRTLSIGGANDWSASSLYWDGALDDVRVYNRALDGAEVKALYNMSPTATCTSVDGISSIVESAVSVYSDKQGYIHINSGGNPINASAQVYNILGQSVVEKDIRMSPNSSSVINIQAQPAGIYLLVIHNGEKYLTWKLNR